MAVAIGGTADMRPTVEKPPMEETAGGVRVAARRCTGYSRSLTAGSKLRIDYRWGADNADLFRGYAAN
jgi:hypothetical protein